MIFIGISLLAFTRSFIRQFVWTGVRYKSESMDEFLSRSYGRAYYWSLRIVGLSFVIFGLYLLMA